jgi:hypothetical protein
MLGEKNEGKKGVWMGGGKKCYQWKIKSEMLPMEPQNKKLKILM